MKRLPILLSLLALVVLAASLAYWVLQLYQPPQRPLAAAPLAAQPEPPIDAAATLFGGQAAAAVATNYTLTGIVADGRDSVAIIVPEGSPPKAIQVGKELAPGVMVTEVHARYVMLSDGGVMKRIELAPDTKGAAVMGAAPGPAGSAPPGGEPPVAAGPVQQPQPVPENPAPEAPPQTAAPAPVPPPSGNAPPAAAQPQGVAPVMPANQPPPPAPVQMPPPTRSTGSPVQANPVTR